MRKTFHLAATPGVRPRLDGIELTENPVRFYQRHVLGGSVCGLWIGGKQVYDVHVFDGHGQSIGSIASEGPVADQNYDALRRVLACEALRT